MWDTANWRLEIGPPSQDNTVGRASFPKQEIKLLIFSGMGRNLQTDKFSNNSFQGCWPVLRFFFFFDWYKIIIIIISKQVRNLEKSCYLPSHFQEFFNNEAIKTANSALIVLALVLKKCLLLLPRISSPLAWKQFFTGSSPKSSPNGFRKCFMRSSSPSLRWLGINSGALTLSFFYANLPF